MGWACTWMQAVHLPGHTVSTNSIWCTQVYHTHARLDVLVSLLFYGCTPTLLNAKPFWSDRSCTTDAVGEQCRLDDNCAPMPHCMPNCDMLLDCTAQVTGHQRLKTE